MPALAQKRALDTTGGGWDVHSGQHVRRAGGRPRGSPVVVAVLASAASRGSCSRSSSSASTSRARRRSRSCSGSWRSSRAWTSSWPSAFPRPAGRSCTASWASSSSSSGSSRSSSPDRQFEALAAVIGFFFLFKGIFDIAVAFATKGEFDMWWLQLVVGLIEIGLAFWVAGSFRDKAILLARLRRHRRAVEGDHGHHARVQAPRAERAHRTRVGDLPTETPARAERPALSSTPREVSPDCARVRPPTCACIGSR